MTQSIFSFLADYDHTEPCLVVDLGVIEKKYQQITKAMPDTDLYYAVKANPEMAVLKKLVSLGSFFDAASFNEVELCLAAGASPDKISFGNTIKRASDIKRAYQKGIRLFSADAILELEKIAQNAPASDIAIRILCDCVGADWPLSKKFGCDPQMGLSLIIAAKKLGLNPRGITFHVGSQQANPAAWEQAISTCYDIFTAAKKENITLDLINLGGGFPVQYTKKIPLFSEYIDQIDAALSKFFPDNRPKTIIEPGRALVAEAGIIQAEVLLISNKTAQDKHKWLFLDIGKFGGLIETMDEAIYYPMKTIYENDPLEEYIIAGPTCDSVDILYEKKPYPLPKSLKIGDKIWISSAGAYTSSYSSVGFNGIPPLKVFVLGDKL